MREWVFYTQYCHSDEERGRISYNKLHLERVTPSTNVLTKNCHCELAKHSAVDLKIRHLKLFPALHCNLLFAYACSLSLESLHFIKGFPLQSGLGLWFNKNGLPQFCHSEERGISYSLVEARLQIRAIGHLLNQNAYHYKYS